MKKKVFWSTLIGFVFLFTALLPTEVMAKEDRRFQKVEQPLTVKLLVTAGGVGLIGLELWWFLGSGNKQK
ncbi:MAG: hypothetical protein ACLFQP_04690 [Halothece sp.]